MLDTLVDSNMSDDVTITIDIKLSNEELKKIASGDKQLLSDKLLSNCCKTWKWVL